MRRSTWTIAVIGLGAVLGSPPSWARNARSGSLPADSCDIAGSWVGNSPPLPGIYSIPLLIKESVTPTDPSGRIFTGVVLPVNGDSTFSGIFPDADQGPAGVATYVRSGPRSYRFTWLAHFVKSPGPGVFDRGEILYFWTLRGTVQCLNANTRTVTGVLSFYSDVNRPELVVPPLGIFGVHDQDTDDDGFADPGETPFYAGEFGLTFKRLR